MTETEWLACELGAPPSRPRLSASRAGGKLLTIPPSYPARPGDGDDPRVLPLVALVALLTPSPVAAQPDKAPAAKAAADPLDGPPFVSARAWVVMDGKTGKVLWGGNEAEARPVASTSKIMTAWIVLRLAAADPKVLDEVVAYSERAAKTTGSSASLGVGDQVPVKELLYGLLLPSGNDAAVALAEHCGPRLGEGADGDGLGRFVAEMNRRATTLGLTGMSFKDPNGLSRENVSSARDLATLTYEAMKDERFRAYVATRRHDCDVVEPGGGKRKVTWTNTNRLLDVDGYEGVKTGTTTPAGNCLVASARRGDDRLIVVVLGSTSADGRYVDARNLFRWAWRERGHKPAVTGGR
ncbi:MAG: D-alanyl-D-alanine carboxypeptidase [Gemmataceae bacterium]|nr:D-alanyl-D-alanine carboxypeptidase [Gemmataceae bacterium]